MKSKRDRSLDVIIPAAIASFADGIGTVKDVADRCGLPKANVHYYFKRKADLYARCIEVASETPDKHDHRKLLARHYIDNDDLTSALGVLR